MQLTHYMQKVPNAGMRCISCARNPKPDSIHDVAMRAASPRKGAIFFSVRVGCEGGKKRLVVKVLLLAQGSSSLS
jgi:hypothetical protein